MGEDKKSYLIIGIAIVLIAFLLYFFSDNSQRVNWYKHYSTYSKDPYGTYLLEELLKEDEHLDYNPNYTTAEQFDSISKIGDPISMFSIGKGLFLSNAKTDSLINFVSRGNSCLLILDKMPDSLMARLSYNWYTSHVIDSIANVTLTTDNYETIDYKYTHVDDFDTTEFHWQTMYDHLINYDYTKEVISTLNEEPNVIEVYIGEGKLILCSSPILFTNFFLRDADKLDYAERIFSRLPEGQLIWNPYHWYYETEGTKWQPQRESPLQFILSNKSFRMAYFFILITFVLLMIFKAKRRQSIVPAIENKDNNSVAFVQNLAELYFMQENHHKLIKHKKRIFLNYVWEHYSISLKNSDPKAMNRLAILSKKEMELIKRILNRFTHNDDKREVSNEFLIELDQDLDTFYSDNNN